MGNPWFFFFFFLCLVFIASAASFPSDQSESILDEYNLGHWRDGVLTTSAAAAAPGPANGLSATLVLAGSRTNRPDVLNGFKRYRGGWDFTNKHYWASVAFTGTAAFVLAVLWFVCFGLGMVIHHCCGWRMDINGKESRGSRKICLVLLLVFTCAATIGCVLLSVGQDEFHGEAIGTLDYVVNQSDYTVQTLKNVTGYLTQAKTVTVSALLLPPDVRDDIDKLNAALSAAAGTLKRKTHENSGKIRNVFDNVRWSMIGVAIVMLVLSLLGLFLSILGYKNAIYIFIVSGWLLVAVTFVLCGAFVILDNAISDTCMAMGQWADNPNSKTALGDILPCVDQSTTNETLYKSKLVINNITNVVNGFIGSYANAYGPPNGFMGPNNFNPSGPLVPYLCSPYDSRLQDQECFTSQQTVSMANASSVWRKYTCTGSTTCKTTGRLLPDMYRQLVAAVNVSYALQHYAPPLLSLQDCNFVRGTFKIITSDHCPPLLRRLRTANVGLALVSVGVMLSLALWIVYANRPQRREAAAAFAKVNATVNDGPPPLSTATPASEV